MKPLSNLKFIQQGSHTQANASQHPMNEVVRIGEESPGFSSQQAPFTSITHTAVWKSQLCENLLTCHNVNRSYAV